MKPIIANLFHSCPWVVMLLSFLNISAIPVKRSGRINQNMLKSALERIKLSIRLAQSATQNNSQQSLIK